MDKNLRHTKLTYAAVAEIRRRYAEGATQKQLAQENHVTIGTIYNIVHHITWQQAAPATQPQQQRQAPIREITDEEIEASVERLKRLLGDDPQPPK